MITPGGEQVWDWQQVVRWVEQKDQQRHVKVAVFSSTRAQTLCTADRVLAARDALWSEPDETAREEFGRLLEDA